MSGHESLTLTQEQLEELELFKRYQQMDTDQSGYIEEDELVNAFKAVDIKVAPYEVRKMIAENDINARDGKLDFQEFMHLCARLRTERDYGRKFKKMVRTRTDVETLGGMTEVSNEGTTHAIANTEMVAFSEWINRALSSDPDCKKYLPLDIKTGDLYSKINDGILLCKLINYSVPDTIDFRAVNMNNLNVYRKSENLELAINSAESIGCTTTNIHPDDLGKGKPHIILGLIWQIVRIGLMSHVNLRDVPNLLVLKYDDETVDEFMKLPPEEILIRWVNYHLKNAGITRRVNNLSGDIKDSEVYTYLLNQIAPRDKHVTLNPMQEQDPLNRADLVLKEADKIDARRFVTSGRDIVSGNPKLNLAFVANLFNEYPCLEEAQLPDDLDLNQYEETREEKTYRNWMNSMGVNPFVYHLYSDLCNGLIIFQLYDIIKPGVVNWTRVHWKFNKLKIKFEMLENCGYAVELGKQLKFSLVGVGGEDLLEGNQTLTLALIWQLMRAYTLSILTQLAGTGHPIVDNEIIQWANTKLEKNGKKVSFNSFQDPRLSNAKVIIDLIDTLKPNSIDYNVVNPNASTDEEKLKNAQYAISMARKIGARVYALPEDIVEVKPKMIMTVFACLMIKEYQPAPGAATTNNQHD